MTDAEFEQLARQTADEDLYDWDYDRKRAGSWAANREIARRIRTGTWTLGG